jgi:hypothetical protein
MKTLGRLPRASATLLLALILTGVLAAHQASGAWIRGISSNFDLHNFTQKPVNDLELTLGGIVASDVINLYAGFASRGWIPEVKEGDGEITIRWKAPEGTHLYPCEWLHLGLSLRAGAPPVKQAKATWTLDGQPGGTVAFVWQNWVGYADSSVGDIIIPPSVFPLVEGTQKPDSLIVSRRWAASGMVIPLDNLTQDDPLVTQVEWSPKSQEDTLTPDSRPSEMTVPPTTEDVQAIVVQYLVILESTLNTEAVFTNEAVIVHDVGPRPRIIKPVDNLRLKPDMVYGVVNLWATETTGLWDDTVILTVFEVSSDGGQRWQPIGLDDDGTVPTYATLPGTYQHNWWNTQWDVSKLDEGSYLVKATMMDREQNVGEDIIELYVDPTPPVPMLMDLSDHQLFLAPREISCNTPDEDIVSVLWEVQPKFLNYTKGIPFLDQHNYGVGKVNDGNMYCAPTGSAACLKWWASNGYSSLTQCLEGYALSDTQLVEGLAGAMGTSSTTGTTGPGIVDGLRKWINDRGLALTVTDHATINPSTIRNELENCKEDVILGILWNDGGGHIVTVNSIANFTNADGTTNIGVMDPWDGANVNIKMEADGDVQWPGRAGVQDAALVVTVSPPKPRIPWILIGRDWHIMFDPGQVKAGLYFLRATLTDSKGNQGSSQIIARVGQPLLPPMLLDFATTAQGAVSLKWLETEYNLKYAYVVEYTDDLASGIWEPVPGKWPIPDLSWSGDNIAGISQRYYRVMKDYEPK